MAVAAMLLPVIAGACGSDARSGGTLPPMITTTTSTSTIYVTTTTILTSYIVQPGDTLSKIAGRFGVTQAELMALNGITNPDHIEKGQKLKLPQVAPTVTSRPPGVASSSSSTG